MNPESIIAQSSRRSPMRADQRAADTTRRAAGLGQQLADDRAQPDDHRDESQRVADAGLKRPRDVGERHARREPNRQRTGRQREKGRHPHPGDQQRRPAATPSAAMKKESALGDHAGSLQSLIASPDPYPSLILSLIPIESMIGPESDPG